MLKAIVFQLRECLRPMSDQYPQIPRHQYCVAVFVFASGSDAVSQRSTTEVLNLMGNDIDLLF